MPATLAAIAGSVIPASLSGHGASDVIQKLLFDAQSASTTRNKVR
jgi:hypothetical protein